jgi:hypothetical protein
MDFLPKTGVCGTLYIFRAATLQWGVLTWDGSSYTQHAQQPTLEGARDVAATLLWAHGWPMVECVSPTAKMNPCVRVELEYHDGQVQTLYGDAAEKWLKNVDSIVTSTHIRMGASQMENHQWKFSRRG